MSDEGITTGTESAPSTDVPAGQQTFHSLADSVLSDSESGDFDGQATTEPEQSAPTTAEEGAVAEGTEPGDEAAEPQEADEVLNALADLSRDDVPEDLLPLYDRIVEARKQMQADYTRKTQAVAEQRKTAEQMQAELDSQVEQRVQAELAKYGVTQLQQQPQADAQGDPLWEGLGEPVTLEQALSAETPAAMQTFIEQQATLKARQEVAALAQLIGPQLQQLANYVQESESRAADAYLDSFVASNPDLEPYVDQMIALVKGGGAKTLDEAADAFRRLADIESQKALEIGMKAGENRARQVQTNKQKFSVPSAATAPKGGSVPQGARSFHDLREAAFAALDD